MKKEKRIITLEEIKSLENDAISSADSLIEDMKNGTRSSPKTEFLNNIKDLILKLVNEKVPYRKIAQWIEDTYSFKVSEQMVRSYAKNVLKISSRKQDKNILDEIAKGIIDSPTLTNNPTTVKEQKKAISNRELSDIEKEETLWYILE